MSSNARVKHATAKYVKAREDLHSFLIIWVFGLVFLGGWSIMVGVLWGLVALAVVVRS